MAGGAPQSANPLQGGQNDQLSALLRNPNLPSMLQNADFSGIDQANQQAIQQAYQRAQQPQPNMGQGPMIAQQRPDFAKGLGAPPQMSDPLPMAPPQMSDPFPTAPPVQNAMGPTRALPPVQNAMGPTRALPPVQNAMGPTRALPPVQNTGGPNITGQMPGGGFGFDQSGSDAGVGGQPVPGIQTPLQGGGQSGGLMRRPPMLSDFRQRQGMQIKGNPTAQPVGGGIGAFGMGRRKQQR